MVRLNANEVDVGRRWLSGRKKPDEKSDRKCVRLSDDTHCMEVVKKQSWKFCSDRATPPGIHRLNNPVVVSSNRCPQSDIHGILTFRLDGVRIFIETTLQVTSASS